MRSCVIHGERHSCYCDELKADPSDNECIVCGTLDCPHSEPFHYHHDGCPACYQDEEPECEIETN